MNKKFAAKLNFTDKERILETLYLIVLALHILRYSFNTTIFNIPWPEDFEWIILVITGCVVLLKVGYSKTYNGYSWILGAAITLIFAFSWLSTERQYLLLIYYPLLIMGAKDVNYRKILKTSFLINLIVLILAMVGSFTGCIENLAYSSENSLKNSFGILYYTTFAASIFYLLITAWLIWDKLSNIVFLIFSVLILLWENHYCGARCSGIVILMFCFIILFYIVKKDKKINDTLVKIFDIAAMLFTPIVSIGTILITYLYNENVKLLEKLNLILSGRLQIGQRAINNYGITIFGTEFEQIGSGGTTISSLDYNFIDSSYVLVAVRYGILVLISIILIYNYIHHKAIIVNNRKINIVLMLIALHCAVEDHILEINYNVFLCMALADLQPKKENSVRNNYKRLGIGSACKIIAFMACLLFISRIFNILRTLVRLLRLYDTERHIIFVLLGLVSLLFITALIYSIKKYIAQRNKRYIWGIFVLLIMAFSVFLKSNSIIRNGSTEYKAIIEEESDKLNDILEVMGKSGKLYVDDVPEVYKKKFTHISNRILPIELCAYEENATIINPVEDELQALIEAGYYFGELSQTHGIYTNNERVAETLEKDGIQMSKCYSVRKDVDLQFMADLNDMTLQDDGSLILEGSDKSLIYGPYLTIKKGHLRVEYDLELIDSTITQGKVATARVSFESGRTVWKEVDIPLEAFDENGEYKLIIDTLIWGNRSGIEFLLFADDGTILKVKDINYGKIEAD